MAAVTVLRNGINYSWGSITPVIFGLPVSAYTGIKYRVKQNKTNNFGAGEKPVSRGYGNEDYECSLSVYRDYLQSLIDAAPNGNPLQIAPFDITILYGDSRTNFRKEILKYCEFLEYGLDANQGDTKLIIELPIIIAGVEPA